MLFESLSGPRWAPPSTAGYASASSYGTDVTAGSANVKGSWAPISAALPHAVAGVTLIGVQSGSSPHRHLFDLGIGAAGDEQVILENFHVCRHSNRFWSPITFPFWLPAGTRLAARTQATSSGAVLTLSALLGRLGRRDHPSPLLGMRSETYGADTANTRGVSIDGGASADTKGAWTQLIAATTRPAAWLAFSVGHAGDVTRVSSRWRFDIGIGAADDEQVIIPDVLINLHDSSEEPYPQAIEPIPVNIPTGVRVSARCQCSTNTAGDRALDLVAYGFCPCL